MRDRFAKEIAVWLEFHTEALNIGHVAVFASPRFLGSLRESWSPRTALSIVEHQENLVHLSKGNIARHKAIKNLMIASVP